MAELYKSQPDVAQPDARDLDTTAGGLTSLRVERCMLWSGLVVIAFFLPGMLLARFLPPHSPAASAETIADKFVEHKTAIRLACALMFVGITFFATWIVSISFWIRKIERGVPILTYSTLVLGTIGTIIFLLGPVFWGVAAFRPEAIDPNITRIFNDAAWIIEVWTGPPYALWAALIGIAILSDRRQPPLLPRWVAYVNFFFAGDVLFTLTVIFFKSGPLAWNGIVSWWSVLVTFLIQIIALTLVMQKAAKVEAAPGTL